MQLTKNKGTGIHRSERICIDISDSVVSVIKLDPQGVMIRAGSAKAPSLPLTGMPDDAYVTDLSGSIKKAAWAAKVSMGFGASCVVGVSMPDMTIQRFRWPDMPTDALLSVVAEEMVPYLPHGKSNFHISCEVLRQEGGEIEVLAAAMPEEHAIAVDTACRWANFKPKRIDIRENARGRLVQHWCAPIEGVMPSTFAILDAGPGAANIAFYHKGLFHSNRYFTPEFVKLEEVDDFEMLMSVKAGGIGDNESAMRYDTRKLTEEIISSVNHFHRFVGGDKISCVLLMDDENIPGIEESLRTGLGTPVLKPSQWVKPGLKRPNLRRENQDSFLDAFAVGMPSLAGHDCRMDLRIPNTPASTASTTDRVRSTIDSAGTRQHATDPVKSRADEHMDRVSTMRKPVGMERALDDRFAADVRTEQQIPDLIRPMTDRFATGAGHTRYDEMQSYDRDNPHESHIAPIPAGYVELPELPPELAALELERDNLKYDEPPPAPPKYHESPFDIISAKTDENSGFPYAIPEGPRPDPNAKKPLIAAIALVAVMFIVAVFIPLRTTRSLRAELQYLEESISAYASTETLFLLEQERYHANRQINAIRRDIERVNERMGVVRDFYLRLPALVFIPEVLEASGLTVDSIVATESAHEHRIVVSGRTNNLASIQHGLEYLRHHSQHHYLMTISFNVAITPDNTGMDAYGYTGYTITAMVNTGWTPFWLNSHTERRWP